MNILMKPENTVLIRHSRKNFKIFKKLCEVRKHKTILLIGDRALFKNILLYPLVHYFNTLKLLKHLKHSYMFRHHNVIITQITDMPPRNHTK